MSTRTRLTDDAKQTAKAHADHTVAQATEAVAETADPYAKAAKSAAHQLDDGSPVAHGLDAVASQIDAASAQLRDLDLNALADHARTAARKNPLLFLGGAALVGFAAARFLKASDAPARNPWANTNLTSRGNHS